MTNYVTIQDKETGMIKNKLIPREKRFVNKDSEYQENDQVFDS